MKLYDAAGPYPDIVRMVLAEKGVTLPAEVLVLRTGDQARPRHLARNPLGQAPVLEIEDGRHISETIAICEYLEEVAPSPPLIGTTATERAETRMWTHRVEFIVAAPLFAGASIATPGVILGREGLSRPRPSAAARRAARGALAWFDEQLAGRHFLCGSRFSLADIFLYVFLGFGVITGQVARPERTPLAEWRDRVGARPSAEGGALKVEPMSLGGTI